MNFIPGKRWRKCPWNFSKSSRFSIKAHSDSDKLGSWEIKWFSKAHQNEYSKVQFSTERPARVGFGAEVWPWAQQAQQQYPPTPPQDSPWLLASSWKAWFPSVGKKGFVGREMASQGWGLSTASDTTWSPRDCQGYVSQKQLICSAHPPYLSSRPPIPPRHWRQ